MSKRTLSLFPGLVHFTLNTYLIMLSVKQAGIKYQFWVFGMNRLVIEPLSLGQLAKTLPTRALGRKIAASSAYFFHENQHFLNANQLNSYIYIYIYIYVYTVCMSIYIYICVCVCVCVCVCLRLCVCVCVCENDFHIY